MSRMFDFVSLWGPWILAAGMVLSVLLLWRDWSLRADLSSGRFVWRLVKHAWLLLTCGVLMWVLEVRLAPLTSALVTMQKQHGTHVPDVTFMGVEDGRPYHLRDFEGRVVLLNLWGTYCPPCVAELPTLAQLQNDYRDRGLVVIALAEEPREQLEKFFSEGPLGQSTKGLLKAYTESLTWVQLRNFRPLTLIIDRNGILRGHFFATPGYAAFAAAIKPLL